MPWLSFKKALKSAAGRASIAAGILQLRCRQSMTIVTFHRVNDELPEDGLTCSSQKFTDFCRFFHKHFWVIPLSEQIDGCRRRQDMRGTLSITFDDGYADNFLVAAPILKRLKLPATFFVTTAFIDSSISPPWDDRLLVPQRWMTWDQVRALAAQGFEVGSHSHKHINFSIPDTSTVRTDLENSRTKLRQQLGVPARLFAYPYGGQQDISEASREIIKGIGFECCLSCFGGVNRCDTDPYHLRRITVGEWFATPHQFALEFVLGRI